MSSFARTLKSPSYLSYRRPVMAGRTFSNSSERSVHSNNSGRSDEGSFPLGEAATSAPSSPAVGVYDGHNLASPLLDFHDAPPAGSVSSRRSSQSRPIAIELPRISRLSSSSVYTPPEPLSARGDVPGGYFPLHEDPKARLHRPHPFHHERKVPGTQSSQMRSEQGPMQTERNLAQAAENANAQVNMPVASYLPAGFHDTPLPMGKYYPSNWEQRHNWGEEDQGDGPRPSLAGKLRPQAMSDTVVPTQTRAMPPSTSEAEARRRMQQYQRDMVAQAAQALGGATNGGAKLAPGFPVKGLSVKDMRMGHVTPHKPNAPKLLPLGSPGPVTPMELESSATAGYLDKGMGPGRARDFLSPQRAGLPAHST